MYCRCQNSFSITTEEVFLVRRISLRIIQEHVRIFVEYYWNILKLYTQKFWEHPRYILCTCTAYCRNIFTVLNDMLKCSRNYRYILVLLYMKNILPIFLNNIPRIFLRNFTYMLRIIYDWFRNLKDEFNFKAFRQFWIRPDGW